MFSRWGLKLFLLYAYNDGGLASEFNGREIHKLDSLGLRLCEGSLSGILGVKVALGRINMFQIALIIINRNKDDKPKKKD